MRRYDRITPEGTRDLMFVQCGARRRVEALVRDVFIKRGYNEVVTPGIEFYDVFHADGRYFSQEDLYKLADSKGRLLVMRPDSTIPIARLVATKLQGRPLPLRLFYNQPVYIQNPTMRGRSDETVQAGIELIGAQGKKSDLEVVLSAVDTLRACNIPSFTIEIGHIGYFNALMESLSKDPNAKISSMEETRENIRELIESKNYVALNDLIDKIGNVKAANALRHLPRLFGGEEVLDRAAELFAQEEAEEVLSYLRSVYQSIRSIDAGCRIIIDLGLVNRIDYYTGIVFQGYAEGMGEAVLSGGRYDGLLSDFGAGYNAIGFGVNIDLLAQNLLASGEYQEEPVKRILIHTGAEEYLKGEAYRKRRMEQGFICEASCFDTENDAIRYASQQGIDEVHLLAETTKVIRKEDYSAVLKEAAI